MPGRSGADLGDLVGVPQDAQPIRFGTRLALGFALLVGCTDLRVDGFLEQQDRVGDALGFGVDQARPFKGRRLQFLALGLESGAQPDQFKPGRARFLVVLGG